MLPDHVLHGGSTEAINGQQKYLTRTNTYKCYKTRKLLLKNVLAKSFFSLMKEVNISESVANVLKLTTDGKGGSGRKKTN